MIFIVLNGSVLQLSNCLVNNTIFNSFISVHPVITVKVRKDLVNGFTAVFSQYFCSHIFNTFGLPGLYLQVRTYSSYKTAQGRLVDHHFTAWIDKTFAFLTAT